MTSHSIERTMIDSSRWPELVHVPNGGPRGMAASMLVRYAAKQLDLRMRFPDGSVIGGGNAHSPVLEIRRPDAFFRRIGASGTIGFGEGYMAGDWDSEDLVGVLQAIASRVATLVPARLQQMRHTFLNRMPAHESNTVKNAKNNIARHYDLSNEMFAAFLDETMTYSAAVFTDDPLSSTEDLTSAQHRKIDKLLDLAQVGKGTRLLEIGTGWGELARRAAARGATVTTVTISEEQASLARARIAEAGLSELVDVQLRDYRLIEGQYDSIVSVEMIEAVGLDHLTSYVQTLDKHLAPGGRVALQAITMPHDRMLASQETYTWIRKYIFPGGQLLSPEAIDASLAAKTSLHIAEKHSYGLHYAKTLERWRETFLANRAEVGALGFDEIFARMWVFYLAYCEAGFRARYLDVYQLLLTRTDVSKARA